MPVWSGLPDKKNPVEGQRGLPHPFVILKIKIYTNISVLQGKIHGFLRGDQTQNFFFNIEAFIRLWTHLKWTPPVLLDSPDGPPPLYPSFAPTQWAPPTVPSLWTHPVDPPLYPSFELPHCTVPLDSLSGPGGVLTSRDLVLRWVFLMKIFVVVKLMMGQIAFPVSFIFRRTSAHTFLHVIVYM